MSFFHRLIDKVDELLIIYFKLILSFGFKKILNRAFNHFSLFMKILRVNKYIFKSVKGSEIKDKHHILVQ